MGFDGQNDTSHSKLKELYEHFGNNFVLVWVLPGRPFEGLAAQPQTLNGLIVSEDESSSIAQFKIDVFADRR